MTTTLTPFATWAADFATHLTACPDPDFVRKIERLAASWVSAPGSGGDPWPVYTLADAYQPRPPVAYVVSGLFEIPSLDVVYGAPGTLKSFLLADLAICVAAGAPWLPPLRDGDPPARSTSQAPVVWLDLDNGQRRTHERFGALGRARSLPDTTPLYYYSMPSPWLDASSEDAIGDLGDRVLARGARLVIVDNLGAVSGGADENSSAMIRILSNLRRLAERTGAAVVLIHHQRKANGIGARAGDRLRGHSSIEAALDLALLVEREDGTDTLNIVSTKTRGVPVSPFGAMFTYEHRPGTNDLAAARFYSALSQQAQEDAEIETAILDVLAVNGPLNQTALWKSVKDAGLDAGQHRIRAIANRMATAGELKTTSGKHGAIQYDVP